MLTSSVGGPLPTEARQGRQKQKYGESGERLLAGCIPFRHKDGCDIRSGVEVLLVTRRNGEGWVLPKGGWESDENTVEAAALRETVEEAGVRGILDTPMLGIFKFTSKKQRNFSVNTCLAHVFAMRVMEQLESWPEQAYRKRGWFSLKEAFELCKDEWMRDAFRVWIKRNNWVTPCITNGVDNVNGIDDDSRHNKRMPDTTAK